MATAWSGKLNASKKMSNFRIVWGLKDIYFGMVTLMKS